MKKKYVILIAIVVVFAVLAMMGSYLNAISGTVVDAETGKPIEGAVVLAEWTITKGLGLTHTGSYRAVEKKTNQNGNFYIMGVVNPFVSPPIITIYKKNYVAWNNEYIFPGFKKRDTTQSSSNHVYKLERFLSGYSHDAHVTFIATVIRSTIGYENKKILINAFDWENDLARDEVKKKNR